MTRDEMLARISSRELTDWAAYEEATGPLDASYRGEVAAAIVAATVANVNRTKKSKLHKPADFLPKWGRSAAQTPNQMATMLKSLTNRLGGTIRKRTEE